MGGLRAVCLIPSPECLAFYDINHWVSMFERRSEHTITDLVLPAVTVTGASYKSKYAVPNPSLSGEASLRHWIETADSELSGVRKWALIDLQLPAMAEEMTSLRDQWNQPLDNSCCIIIPQVQSMLGTIFGEIRQMGVDGIVLDISDIFPNSTGSRYPARKTKTTSVRQPLQNTCFCQDCLKALERNGWSGGVDPFTSIDGNISRFVLQPSAKPLGGVDPNTVEDSWLESLNGDRLVEYANFRGFVEVNTSEEREKAIKDAVKLIRYMTARAKVTAQALKALGAMAMQENLTTAIAMSSALYDQSQNVNLSALLRLSCADEYWAESFQANHLNVAASGPGDAAPVFLRLTVSRGIYYVNSVFEYLDGITKLRAFEEEEWSQGRFLEMAISLDRRDQLTADQCAHIPLFKGLQGFVGVPLKTDDMRDLLKKMAASGFIANAVKNHLLARMSPGTESASEVDGETPDSSIWE